MITGAGPAFCSGRDPREHAELLAHATVAKPDMVRRHYNPIIETIANMAKPTLAAPALMYAGAGASLAFACDFRIAAERCKPAPGLRQGRARRGLRCVVDAAAAGRGRQGSRTADAGRAHRLGHRAATRFADLSRPRRRASPAAAASFAARLADGPTLAYAAIKESLLYGSSHTLGESLEKEADLQERLGASADHGAATEAFVAKRAPVYHGR